MTGTEQRLAALEAEVEALRGEGEALVPNYLTIDPATGQVGANFSGTVNAQGVILPAGAAEVYPGPQNSVIRWTRQSDGSLVAYAYAYSDNPTNGVAELTAVLGGAGGEADALLRAVDTLGITRAAVTVTHQDGGVKTITLTAGAIQQLLLRDDGTSSFAQIAKNLADLNATTARGNLGLGSAAQQPANEFPNLPVAKNNQILWGGFNAGATAPIAGNSGGFTCNKVAVGQYTITFTNPFSINGYGFAPVVVNGYCNIASAARLAGSCEVELRTFADVLQDASWAFMAIGTV